ncbi:hypothetical protein ACCO45_008448 [Purpureocillium lilacinum]|uniref:Uncharacterized protein n=1 Tax=Purpureocillium lilacinum TaxID=33203 RepID=A0ACC4DNC7_PURLI
MQAAAAPAARGATPAQPAGSLRGLVADVVGARPRNDDMLCASQMDDWDWRRKAGTAQRAPGQAQAPAARSIGPDKHPQSAATPPPLPLPTQLRFHFQWLLPVEVRRAGRAGRPAPGTRPDRTACLAPDCAVPMINPPPPIGAPLALGPC